MNGYEVIAYALLAIIAHKACPARRGADERPGLRESISPFQSSMEFIEFLNQTRVIRHNGLALKVRFVICNKALLPSFPRLPMLMSTALVSMSYRGF